MITLNELSTVDVTDRDGIRVFNPEQSTAVAITDQRAADEAVNEIIEYMNRHSVEVFEIRFDVPRKVGVVRLINDDEILDILIPNEQAMMQLSASLYAYQLKKQLGLSRPVSLGKTSV